MNYEFRNFQEIEEQLNLEGSNGWVVVEYNETKPSKLGEKYKAEVLFETTNNNE